MPNITLGDVSLGVYGLSDRVTHLRDIYFKTMPEICVERAQLITSFSNDHGFFKRNRISILDKAKMYRYVLEQRNPIVRHPQGVDKDMKPFPFKDTQLFAGSTTSRLKGVPLYPEFLALTLWPELWTITKRESNPFYITEDEVKNLNQEVFPPFLENNILELARKRYYEQNLQQYGLKKYAPEIKLLEHLVFFLAAKPECISHTIPDFRMAVKHGLRAIIDEAREREAATDDLAQREFYAAIQEVQEGIIGYSRNLAAEAEKLADGEIDPIEKQELLDIAQVHRQVPEFPARSFREALTSVWICWTAMHLENPNIGLSLGRLDQVLYDFYRQDLEQGRINVADAIELICCLWLKIGDHVPAVPQVTEQLFGGTGSNQAITLGGVDQDGEDAVNDLTYVMLRATELMKLRDPNLNARYYSGVNDEKYLRRLCEVNLNTGATPALHNDRAVIKSLMSKGDTLEQARDYGAIGCIEPGSNGRFYGASSAILLNLTSVLELALFNGKHRHTGIESKDPVISKGTGDPRTFATFTEFTRALEEQIRWIADQSTNLNNFFGKIHQDFYPTPILSSLIEGPLEKGRDLIEGGAVINSSGVTVIGLADVADSLSAIEELVFDEKAVSFTELLKALEKNFEGYEVLQTRLMNPEKTPKYGNEDAKADANVQWLVETLDQVFGEKPNYRGGHYRVGYWTMTNHAGFGKLTEAFPNGRKAYENFASGITPVSGVTPSLTKALNSVARLPVSCLSNGVPLNLKYTPECDRGKMLDNFVATVEGYFDDAGGTRDGGMEIQFNIVTHDTLVDAVLHPENNPQLLVRVSGFTAYFKDLNSQMQKEIIDRTEYLLSTRNMVPFEPFPLPKKE